jgi:PAS domain S-box-containing protein
MNSPTYTLLIVEDFLADRELYRRSLSNDSSCTYCVLEAESVAEGLEICHSHKIDAVLLDYMLPDADGLEFLAQLSAQSSNSPPVVMMTGQGSESIAVRAIKAGAQDYLVKRDLTPELLQLTMRKAIDNHRLRRQLQQCQERFQMSIANMRECVGIFSTLRDDFGQIIDFRFDYLNAAALESNRMSGEDIGKFLCEVFPAVRTSGLFAEYCQLVETAQPLIKEELVYEDVFGGERLTRAYSLSATKLDDGFVSCWRDETAQRKAEKELQGANQRIIEIWESMTDAYVTVDRDWRITYANQSATQVISQLTNLEPEKFLGRSHWDLFPSLVGGDVEREFRRALTDRVAVHLEVWFEPTESWFETHLYPSNEGLGIYFRDITDRKLMEMERIAAEQERDRFFNLSLDLLVTINFSGYFTRINPAWERTLGFTTAELMERPFIEFVHPDDRAATLTAAQDVIAGGVLMSFENRYLCKDGSYLWLLWSAIPYPEQDLMYAIGHDVTDRKQMEETLRESERKFSAIFEQSFELIGLLSVDGVLLEVNQTALDSIDIRKEDVIGIEFWETPWWNHSPQVQSQLKATIERVASGGFDRYQMQMPTPRGAIVDIDFSLTPIYDETGRVVTLVAEGRDISNLKQAERSLQESERKFSAIFEQSFELMGIVSLDGVLLEVNQTALDSIEAQRADITGKHFWDAPWWHTPQLQQQLKEAIERAGKGEFSRYEVQFPHPSGVMLTTDFSLKPVFDDADRVWTIMAEAHDITDRKRAERDLQESQERLRTGIAVAGVGLARFEYATNLVALSPEAAALYGFDPDTSFVTREQIHDTFHPNERAELEEIIAQVIDPAGTGWFARDHQVVWPNGEVRCLSVRKQVFFDRSGAVARPSYAVLAAIDITERKHAERELKESEERLQTGIEVAGVGLAKFDYATNLVSLSPEAAALYGFAPDELIVTREQIHDTFHPDERAELEAIIAQVIDPQGTGWFARDHQVVWPNGEVRCLSVRKQVFFNRVGAVGCPSYAMLAAIDITEQQAALRERNQTLADLEARNRELDSFVHVVSHDLKAPLRAVSNLSQWIEEDLEGALSAANQQQMNLLRSRIQRMEATIDGLLDYARIGRTEDSLEPVAVCALIAETIETLSPPPTFQIAIAKNLPMLYTKRILLAQVFANLIGNGIKHHDRVDGAIHIGIAERSDVYEFTIADDGPGIAPEQHDRVFRIFQAVNPQNRSDSTGIGLAIVKKIVEAQGGTIRLESQLGKGTTFYFTWPKGGQNTSTLLENRGISSGAF